MADPLELELKLELDRGDRKRLRSINLLKSAHGETHRLVSTYFDTPARELRQAGFSLRVRRIGRKTVQNGKATGQPPPGLFSAPARVRPPREDRALHLD